MLNTYSHLRLMLWKNLNMRMHYPIIALLEFLLPIVIFHQGLNFRIVFETTTIKNATVYPPSRQNILYDPLNNSSTTILYSPKDDFTTSIIGAIKNVINVSETTGIDDETALESTFADRSFIQSHQNISSWKAFGILFQSGKDNLSFTYKIITYNFLLNKETRKLFSDDFAVATNKEDEYLTSGFLGLQFALDTAFINMKSEQVSNIPNITIQKFPYPEYLVERFPESIVYLLTLIGLVFLALTVPYYIATERHTGMKEIMKMMGINELAIWFGWITYSLMIYPVVITIIVLILKAGITIEPFYHNIDAILLWMIFILYCIANMTFLFSIGTLVNKHWVAIVTSVAITFITSADFLTSLTNEYDGEEVKIVAIVLLCMVPNLVLYNAFKALQYFEMKGKYTGWSSLVTNIRDPQILHLRTIIIYFITNIFLNSLIIMYVSNIHPGKYGCRKHPFFMFTWLINFFRKKKEPKIIPDMDIDNEYFEPIDTKRLGMQIFDLQKSFGYFSPFFALKDVDLNVPRGEITVVLGHNGAGKTTLLSVVSGMLSKTSGKILYVDEGKVINSDQLNGKIGYCSQHTIYFNYLTVEEHILFFGMARGLTELQAYREAYHLLTLFDMQEKGNNMINELSGGMKKKLSLLMALIGRPDILVLDEPTSGMDIYSRRMTWDLLKKMKKNRTIIITTQDMEEADIIGDRIAIMHDGQIFCYGSPLFLKTLFGTGYNLILTKETGYDSEVTTKLIKGIIPSATIIKDSEKTAKYNLPILATSSFSSLFESLEYHLKRLFISRIQMFCTTIDQVFVNVTFLAGKDTDRQVASSLPVIDELEIEQSSGPSLVFRQLAALFVKKMKLTYRRYIRFLSCILLTLVLGLMNIKIIDWTYLIFGNLNYLPLNLSISTYPNAEVLLFYHGKNASIFAKLYEQYVFEKKGFPSLYENANVTQGLLEFSKYNLYEFRDNVIAAIELTDNHHNANVLYNELIPHSPPISLNAYSNVLLRYLMKNTSASIHAIYQPIAISVRESYCGATHLTSYTFAAFWWLFIFNSAIVALFVFLISFIISERVHGIKHIQTMSNLPELTYWLGNFIFDYFAYVVLVTLTLCIMRYSDSYGVFPFSDMKVLFSVLLLYGICGLLYSYVFVSLFDSLSMFMLINIVINVSSLTTLLVMQVKGSSLFYPLRVVTAILPPFTFLNILARFLYFLINNNQCVYCMNWEEQLCKRKNKIMDMYTANPLESKFQNSISDFMGYLFMDIFIYAPLLIILNSNFVAWLWNALTNFIFGKDVFIDENDLIEEDDFVKSEKQLVDNIFTNDAITDHALLVHKLKKNLIVNGFRKFTAIADVNFFVSKGSCFGVVGINGAGKSTIMKVLTAFTLPTDGDAKVYNISMRKNLRKYTSMVGYCPQSNAIFEELTGREMLLLTATLRGLKQREQHVDKWILIFDLERYQNNLIETYSTGSKRKLCTALSLIGDPLVVFLDEPTTGVDPLARQLLYKMIKGRKRTGQAIVIATHGLKECEILCDRVTVLQNGILKRIGSVTSLKKQYAVGFTLLVKLRNVSNISEKVDSLIDAILKAFRNDQGFLKDQRVGLLHFRISNEETRWSVLFGAMERIKNLYEIVQEYIITNTTVEEIFISSHENF